MDRHQYYIAAKLTHTMAPKSIHIIPSAGNNNGIQKRETEEKRKHDAGIFNQLSNDSFSIEQKVLDEQIELHIGAIQSRVRFRFIHETTNGKRTTKFIQDHILLVRSAIQHMD